jgi:predicted unusual protein kinase regulating ubiquinone biosynthesis (AarF/ABC1/UbiB family)
MIEAKAKTEPTGEILSLEDAPTSIDLRRLSPGDAARLVEIVMVLARNGLLVVARRNRRLVLAPSRQAPRALAVALRRSFAQLGPTFIKFGQVIASSPGLFPRFLADEFRRLLDDVPPEPAWRIRATIERELGAPIQDLFASFGNAPIAAASVAQVHRAVLPNGDVVAVKVRRPRLHSRAERDLRLLRVLALVLSRMGAIGDTLNPVAIVDDFADTLRVELDFRNEAAAMTEVAAVFDQLGVAGDVVVPEPVAGMVTERVLVMSFIDGTPVDHAEALQEAGHDLVGLVRSGVQAWVGSALGHGLFHGDVHAGNLFITTDGRVAFLDFGIMGRLDEHARGVLRRALPAVLIENDFEAVTSAVFELGAATRPVDLEAAAADVRDLLGPVLSRPLSELSYGELLSDVLSVAVRYHVRLPRELVLVVKQLLYFERYAKVLTPDYPLLADPRILEFIVGPRHVAVERPVLSTKPVVRSTEAELAVVRDPATFTFTWDYTGDRPELSKLYDKAKRSQWNATTDIDWSIDVDPLDTGGLASYLPMMASSSFAKFNEAEVANASHHFNAWLTSQFLHGEQGALVATAKLVEQVPSVEAKFYGATQVADEARHVEAYARYLDEKLELTYPVNDNLAELLQLVVADPRWDVTYLGMQIIVEGIALAAFGLIHQFSTEPLIKQITRYVMADEARHVAFGTLSLAGVYDEMTSAELREREDFIVEAAWLMRDRFLAQDVWENLGIPLDDGLRDAANSPMLQLFQRVLFAKITPNLRKIGLLSDDLRSRLVSIGAIAVD